MILVPITTRFLTRADYGVQDLLPQVVIILSILMGSYFGMSLGYFYYATEPSAQHKVVGTSVVGSLMLGTFACLLAIPFSGILARLIFPHIPAAPYLRLMFLLLPLSFFFDAVMTWLRVADRRVVYLLGSVLRAGLTIICAIWFVGVLKLHV
jgi:Na+-driven multidrug efflux pump